MSGTLFALVLFLGNPGSPSQRPAIKTEQSCTVEGTIIAADTGQPLRKVWVSLNKAEGRGDSPGAGTDASGHFILKNVAPGRYHLAASHAGYVRQEYGQRGDGGWNTGTILSLSAGQQVREITMRLIRAAAISGHIYDEDGDPVEAAQVNALRYGYQEGRRRLMGQRFAVTNDLGEYRLYGLAPGSYIISASHNPNQFQYGGGSAGPAYPPAYYPSALDPAEASPVTVQGGDDFPGVDLALQPVRTVTISGRVFNAVTGEPGTHANLFLMPHRRTEAGVFSLQMQTYVQDPQGTFKLENVVPGSYFLIGLSQVEGKQYVSRLPLEVGEADVAGITLTITPGITLKGRVTGLGKDELAGVGIYLNARDQEVFFSNTSTNPRADGSFEIANLSDGSYRVIVDQLLEDAYVKDIKAGEHSVLVSGIEVTGGQNPGSLEIIVSPNGGRVDGTAIKDNQSFSGATVVLVPNDAALREDARFFKVTNTDQGGSFSFRGIRPGEYEVYAWEKIEPGAYQDASFMDQYKDQGTAIEVKEGNQVSVRLRVISSIPSP